MSGRSLKAFYIAGLVLTVGIMSWQDMRPAPAPHRAAAFSYYAGKDVTPAVVPDNGLPLVLLQGVPGAMPPTLFAQRQLNLMFQLETPSVSVDKISAIITSWEKLGNSVEEITIRYAPAAPDLPAYTALLKELHARFNRERLIAAVVPGDWLVAHKDALMQWRGTVAQIIVPVSADELQMRAGQAQGLPCNIVFQLPGDTLPALPSEVLNSLPPDARLMLTLDPSRPPPTQTKKIGLFPHL